MRSGRSLTFFLCPICMRIHCLKDFPTVHVLKLTPGERERERERERESVCFQAVSNVSALMHSFLPPHSLSPLTTILIPPPPFLSIQSSFLPTSLPLQHYNFLLLFQPTHPTPSLSPSSPRPSTFRLASHA